MKQLLILLTFIVPIVLNAQKANPYVGVSLGTFARNQHFKSNSFNVSIDYRYTYTNKHLGIGFISSFDFFPKFKYLDETTELFFTNIGAEFFILSKDNSGFLIGGAIEYPLNIDDGFSRKSQTKTMRLLPSFNIGISEKKFTILLSYKHYDYTNSYKINMLHPHFDVIETVRFSTLRLVCRYKMTIKGQINKKSLKN